MEKLQYDSFYKFLVSVGVILITGPFFGIYYLLSGAFDIKVTTEDLKNLSEASRMLFEKKTELIQTAFHYLPTFLYALIIVGFICLVIGGIFWSRIQKVQDDGILYDTQKKFADIYKCTPEDVILKILEKYALEHKDILTSNDTIINLVNKLSNLVEKNEPGLLKKVAEVIRELKSYAGKKGTRIIRSTALADDVRVENDFFEYINCVLKKDYTVIQNLRYDSYYYDIIAMSLKRQKDIIFEIFFDDSGELKDKVIIQRARHINGAVNCYIQKQKRKASPKLVILTRSAVSEERQDIIRNIVSGEVKKTPAVDIEFFTLEQIQSPQNTN